MLCCRSEKDPQAGVKALRKIDRRYLNILIAYLIIGLIATKAHSENDSCPYPEIYIEIDQAYHECVNGIVKKNASCDFFADKIKLLLPKYDCQRSFDTAPVPAIWLFGAAYEDYYRLLYHLAIGKKDKFDSHWFSKARKTAREIFLSDGFKAVLDGAIAEEYLPLIDNLKQRHLNQNN